MRRFTFVAMLIVPVMTASVACSSGTTTTQGSGQVSPPSGQQSTTSQPSSSAARTYSGPAPAAGRGALSGRVTWNERPVAKAAVRLCTQVSTFSGCKGQRYDTTTSTDGNYLFQDITPGQYSVMVKAFHSSSYVFIRTLSMEGETITVTAGKGLDIGDFPFVRFDLVMTTPRDEAHVSQARPALTWPAYTGAARYEVALMPEHGKSVFTSEEVEQPTITPPEDLLTCEYSWWVEAYNANGVQIGESADHYRFHVQGQPASCYVDVLSPADHASVAATGVTLKWKAHPLAAVYKLQAWREYESAKPVLNLLEVRGTTYTFPGRLAAGTYVYFVNAVNSEGDIVATNNTRYFTVG